MKEMIKSIERIGMLQGIVYAYIPIFIFMFSISIVKISNFIVFINSGSEFTLSDYIMLGIITLIAASIVWGLSACGKYLDSMLKSISINVKNAQEESKSSILFENKNKMVNTYTLVSPLAICITIMSLVVFGNSTIALLISCAIFITPLMLLQAYYCPKILTDYEISIRNIRMIQKYGIDEAERRISELDGEEFTFERDTENETDTLSEVKYDKKTITVAEVFQHTND